VQSTRHAVWPLGGNCPASGALHISDDIAAFECVDRETGVQLPEGETGEIVFTNLIGDTAAPALPEP
jgi:phenylacetate-coenzyme A ligase PaaK-like adenylate-forming protein